MQVGFALPQFSQQAFEVARTAEFAREVERAGGASLWVGDRHLAAVNPQALPRGSSALSSVLHSAADPISLLSVAASATERVLVGSHVLVAPLYPPVALARSLTTIDLISGGRLVAGFGTGWSPDEYEAAGVEFATRGARMDEVLEALQAIWNNDPAEYRGKHLSVPLHHAALKPVRRPHPPIYLAGRTRRALRRLAEYADGWLPMSTVPNGVDLEGLIHQRGVIDLLAQQLGRDPSGIETVLRVGIEPGTSSQRVAQAITAVHERTAIGHFVVDAMYSDEHLDQALLRATDILELLTGA